MAEQQRQLEILKSEPKISDLKIFGMSLNAPNNFCVPKEATYVDIIKEPQYVIMKCEKSDDPYDVTNVFFDTSGKLVVRVIRDQYFTISPPIPSDIVSKAIEFYGTPRIANSGLVVYRDAHNERGIRKNTGEGAGLSLRVKGCFENYMKGECPLGKAGQAIAWRLRYELVDNAQYDAAVSDGKRKVKDAVDTKIKGQKF